MWNRRARGWGIRFSRSMWLLLGLLALLPVMAWLQYRWIGQVSDAAGQRAQTRLDHAVEQMITEFDGEITRAQLIFWQMPPGHEDPAARFAARYRDWSRLAPYPQLIREVHLIETTEEPWRLSRIESSGSVAALPEWPSKFAAVKARVEEPGRRGPEPGFRRMNGFDDLSIDGNPTFLVPIREPREPRAPGEPREPRREQAPDRRWRPFGPPLGWVVVTLDADFIKREFLPELTRRLFAQGGESEFELLVVKTAEPENIVFQSDPAASKSQFASPDSIAGLFAVRPGCFFQEGAGPGPGPGPFPRGRRTDVLTQKPSACGAAARVLGASDGAWKLLVKHRAGSLATAVASFRLRTMVISFGVLLVLTLGITMLTISTERARVLAKLQMEFAMGISHELRTPLTVIRVAADNIASGMMENTRHAQKYGQLIGDEARRLTDMVEQILTFARARSDGAELKSVAPEQIVSRALTACGPVLREAGMVVERSVEPGLPEVQGDLNLIVDCVQNLINNAVKYAKAGGWVRVRAEKAPDSGGSRIRIAVEDRGPGVAPEDLPHIFDPFYRGEAVRSSQIPGVGLGLSLVKRIVEAHRGTVTVESSAGSGATFFLYLPAQPPQVQPAGAMKQVTS